MYTFDELKAAAQPLLDAMHKGRNTGMWFSDYTETVFVLEKGRKYHRIVQDTRNKQTGEMFDQRSVAGFLDNDGNILKAAGWKAPAKGIRGNIFNNPENAIDRSGYVRYLR